MTAVTASLDHVRQWLDARFPWASAPARREGRPGLRNGDALASYLFGILSPLPLLGLLFGVAAVVVGRRGLRQARRSSEAEGVLQCRIGIALGGLFSVVYLATSLFLIALMI